MITSFVQCHLSLHFTDHSQTKHCEPGGLLEHKLRYFIPTPKSPHPNHMLRVTRSDVDTACSTEAEIASLLATDVPVMMIDCWRYGKIRLADLRDVLPPTVSDTEVSAVRSLLWSSSEFDGFVLRLQGQANKGDIMYCDQGWYYRKQNRYEDISAGEDWFWVPPEEPIYDTALLVSRVPRSATGLRVFLASQEAFKRSFSAFETPYFSHEDDGTVRMLP
jgi:hypothetical protein